MSSEAGVTRRGVIAAAAGSVALVGTSTALAACGTDSPAGDAGTVAPITVDAGVVPVGSAAIVEFVVVSQPTAGNFKAFSAICTHQQCLVSQVLYDRIICTCHQSVYSAADGSVVSGPAPRPLYELTVTQSGDALTIT